MVQAILRNEDFKSSSTVNNVQGIIYKDDGFPFGRIISPNIGAVYLDNLSGMLWICTIANSSSTLAWKPLNADTSTTIATDNSVQEGDLIGIYGAGSWSLSGNLSAAKLFLAGAGSQNAGLVAGGTIVAVQNTTELFNGATWSLSGLLSASKQGMAGAGSQNAGLVAGGAIVAQQNVTELFNGSAWNLSGNLTASKTSLSGAGSQNAGLMAGGITSLVFNSTELFNGSTWALSGNLNLSREILASAGSQNAALVAGGFNSISITMSNTSELFNGSAWSLSGNLNASKTDMAGAGSQNAGLVAGGVISPGFPTSGAELFNGSVWSLSGNLNSAKNDIAGAGSQNAGLVAGYTLACELHTQNTYRKLKFSYMQNALNIGIAYNTSVSSLTATLMTGDISNQYVPYSNFFGINKNNNDQTEGYISNINSSLSSIVAISTNVATLNLATTFTNCFWKGMLLLDNFGNQYPVIGGTNKAPIVRWPNVSSSASTGLFTLFPIWGHKFNGLSSTNIVLTNNSLVLTITTTDSIDSTTFQRFCRIGGTLFIPYSSVSGANGSSVNYGSYYINSVSGFSVSVTKINTLSATENLIVGGINILQHIYTSPTCFDTDATMLGYRNKMHIPYSAFTDDSGNGRF